MSVAVSVIDTKIANTASILAGLRRAGLEPTLVSSPQSIRESNALVLPGVGSFEAGISSLRENSLIDPLKHHVNDGKPFLSVCLGMQLLFESSEESPGFTGLSLLPGHLQRFPSDVVVPHFGWNRLESNNTFFPEDYVYFANSFCLTTPPDGWTYATCRHGENFVAGIQKGSQCALQFHPEISGKAGAQILANWRQSW
ncbi:MAG TPA: imidazole glycerol phosphate synthase subunit HisH [Fimbriimonas sp.]|nr:imidazole glycerol phosphate synthase subunit HisH [Fimbriimonas sp.]